MPERSNGTVSKTVVPLRVPRVRIPASPLLMKSSFTLYTKVELLFSLYD